MNRITAEEAHEIAAINALNSSAYILQPVYAEIRTAAEMGKYSVKVQYPEGSYDDYMLASNKLVRDGFRVALDRNDPTGRTRIISWIDMQYV